MVDLAINFESIAYPSEKGGYNWRCSNLFNTFSIAYPSEKGSYNCLVLGLRDYENGIWFFS